MKAVIIESGKIPRTLPHLVEAATKLSLEPIAITLPDYPIKLIEHLRQVQEPFLFYSMIDYEEGFLLETELLQMGGISFLDNPETAFCCRNKAFQSLVFQKNGLTVPRTMIGYDSADIPAITENLETFPLVVKTTHGERGVGVIKVESLEGLISVLDLLIKQGLSHIIQEYIEMDYYVRVVIVGTRVLGEIRYNIPPGDFRLRSMKYLTATPIKLPPTVIDECFQAMRLLGVEFAGIDLLVKDSRYHIAEVNYPCIYLNVQKFTEENISEEIWRYLMAKQQLL